MGEYYLGDPCYVIPDDEWSDFCSIMRDDGEDFEYKGETCRVIGTGGDGSFGGLSVDAGIIGVIPVVLCDPDSLKATVPSDARLINRFATLEKYGWGDIILVDDDPINGYHCECGNTIWPHVIPAGQWLHHLVSIIRTMAHTVTKIVPPKNNANNAGMILSLVVAIYFAMIVHTIPFAVAPKTTLRMMKTSVPIVRQTMTQTMRKNDRILY